MSWDHRPWDTQSRQRERMEFERLEFKRREIEEELNSWSSAFFFLYLICNKK